LFVTVINSYSIGYAMNIKTQESRSDGNKIRVEYMKKHYVFVNAFSYIWILFIANSYYMMNYHYDILEDLNDGVIGVVSAKDNKTEIDKAKTVIII
jgi:hypothetical protein